MSTTFLHAAERQRYQVAIVGQTLKLVGDEELTEVTAAAEQLDKTVRQLLAEGPRSDVTKAVLLAALQSTLEARKLAQRLAVQHEQRAEQEAKLLELLRESEF